jgi:hypothetical protein
MFNHKEENPLKDAPTSEDININICFNYWTFLKFLFPNTFESDKVAYDFYQDYCKRAKMLNEIEDIYKIPFEFNINYKIDLLSGLVLSWNTYSNSPQNDCRFIPLNYEETKDLGLKQELLRIYEENSEHLKSLGIIRKYSWGDLCTFNRFILGHWGLTNPGANFYDDCFQIPTDRIIIDLRKIATNMRSLSDKLEEIEKALEDKYKEYNCEFDLKDFEVKLKTNMFTVYIKAKYHFPATDCNYSLEYSNLPYKHIDLC